MWTSLDDLAWNKTNTSGNYASRIAEVIPTAHDAAWSMDAWVNMANARADNTYYGLLSQAGDTNADSAAYEIYLRNDLIFISAAKSALPTSQAFIFAAPVPKGQWVHIAWTWTATDETKLYVNGSEVYSESSFVRNASAGSIFTLGGVRRTTEPLEFFGHLDQVKIWNGTLSAADVATSMHTYAANGISGKTLRAHYDFNEFNDGAVLDRTGNNYLSLIHI